jgi:uncharacterized protein
MRIAGQHTVAAPREKVWEALQDPAVLARTLPGCEALEVTGPDAYAATITAGVASVKGTYAGSVLLTDKEEPARYRMKASGSGGPGTISADAEVRLFHMYVHEPLMRDGVPGMQMAEEMGGVKR